MKEQLKKLNPLWVVLGVALVLRFFLLGSWSLSNDELSGLNRTSPDSFLEMIDYGVRSEGHPAGYHTFVYAWTGIVGTGTWLYRLPFALAGWAAVYLLFLIGQRWFNRSVGLAVAGAWAVMEFPLLYSQLARPYALGMAAVLLMAWGWTRIVLDRQKWWNWPYLIGAVACLYLHYFSFLMVGLFGLAGLFFVQRSWRLKFVLLQVGILLSFLPHIGLFFDQLAQGGIGEWLDPPTLEFWYEHPFFLLNESLTLLALSGVFFVFTGFHVIKSKQAIRFRLLSLFLFLMPLAIGYFYSVLRAPLLQNSTLLFSAPFFFLGLFSFLPTFTRKEEWVLVAFVLILGGTSTIWERGFYTHPYFGEFEGIAEKLMETQDQTDNDLAIFASLNHPSYLGYYFERNDREFTPIKSEFKPSDVARLGSKVDSLSAAGVGHVAFVWSSCYYPPEAPAVIAQRYPGVQRFQWFNAEAWIFSKVGASREEPNFYSEGNSRNPSNFWRFDRAPAPGLPNSQLEKMSGDEAFSGTFETAWNKILPGVDERCLVEASLVFRQDEAAEGELVLTFERGDSTVGWHSIPLTNFERSPGQEWATATLTRAMPHERNANRVKSYVWKTKTDGDILIQSFDVSVYREEKDLYKRTDFLRDWH